MLIEYLTWDSSFFKEKVYQISSVESHTELYEALSRISQKCMIYVFSQCKLKNLTPLITKVTYEQKLKYQTQSSLSSFDYEIEACYDQKPSKELYSLALQSGLHSRFNRDPKISKHRFSKLYQLWLDKSLSRKIADQVYVATEKNNQVGLVSVQNKLDHCKIGLISVDAANQGKGVGTSLINAVFCYAWQEKIPKVQVVTQKQNTNACRFYEKNGFQSIKEEFVYHLHL